MTKSINKMIMAFLVVILVLLSVVLMPRTALANEDDYEYDDYGYIFYVNEQTGYQAYVIDYMDLLKESEEISLLEEMKMHMKVQQKDYIQTYMMRKVEQSFL